jgi:nicotinate-nucleotide pyrophosphorylase (carboxylating)
MRRPRPGAPGRGRGADDAARQHAARRGAGRGGRGAGRRPAAAASEISGGIDLDTVAAYATTGADLVSIGALTHSAPVLDIGLDVVPG